MAVSDEESVKALNDSLKKLKEITTNVNVILTKVDKMADKTDHEIYGKDGTLPQVNAVLKDIVGKLQKLDKTVDNINKISTDASEGMKDFHMLRSDIDDVLNTLSDVVKNWTRSSGQKSPGV